MTNQILKKKIGMIGLGNMGSALACSILNEGYDLTVWNRTLSKAQSIGTDGATIADSALNVAQSCDILVVSLLDHSATRASIISSEVGEALREKISFN